VLLDRASSSGRPVIFVFIRCNGVAVAFFRVKERPGERHPTSLACRTYGLRGAGYDRNAASPAQQDQPRYGARQPTHKSY